MLANNLSLHIPIRDSATQVHSIMPKGLNHLTQDNHPLRVQYLSPKCWRILHQEMTRRRLSRIFDKQCRILETLHIVFHGGMHEHMNVWVNTCLSVLLYVYRYMHVLSLSRRLKSLFTWWRETHTQRNHAPENMNHSDLNNVKRENFSTPYNFELHYAPVECGNYFNESCQIDQEGHHITTVSENHLLILMKLNLPSAKETKIIIIILWTAT